MDPSRLLPDTQYPVRRLRSSLVDGFAKRSGGRLKVWDGGRNRWVIPGLQAAQPYRSVRHSMANAGFKGVAATCVFLKEAFDEIDRGAALSVFGVRGAEVVVKEQGADQQ